MSASTDFEERILPACKSFDASLSSIRNTLSFLKLSERLRPRLGSYLRWDTLDPNSRSLLEEFMNSPKDDNNRPAYGFIVVGYGAFEELVLNITEAAAAWISSYKKYEELDEQIKTENIYRTGRLLSMIKNLRTDIAIDHKELGSNLGKCYEPSSSYNFNSTAFRYEAGVLDIENLEKLTKRVGIKINWDRVGAIPAIKDYFSENSVRRVAKHACLEWNSYTQLRSRIAHTGGEELSLEFDEIDRKIQFLVRFGEAFKTVYSNEICAKYG